MDVSAIEIELERGETGLGFNIRGGIDQPYIHHDKGIFVTKIRDDGAAAKDGRINVGDKILSINDTSVEDVQHDDAVALFVRAGDSVKLLVQPGAERTILEMHESAVYDRPPARAENSTTWVLPLVVIGVAVIGGVFYFKLR
ncbi:synaptojanin-2-binding protein-like [Glandiceps talaboti]